MRYPDISKFSVEIAQKVDVGPQNLHEHVPREAVFRDHVVEPLQRGPELPYIARRLYVRPVDIEKFGFSDRCRRCAYDMRNGKNKTGMGHSDYCRQRITECLRGTPEGRRRLEEFSIRTADGDGNPDEPDRDVPDGQGGMDDSGGQQEHHSAPIPAFEPLPRGPHDSAPTPTPAPAAATSIPTPVGDAAPLTPNVSEARERMEAFAQRRRSRSSHG